MRRLADGTLELDGEDVAGRMFWRRECAACGEQIFIGSHAHRHMDTGELDEMPCVRVEYAPTGKVLTEEQYVEMRRSL